MHMHVCLTGVNIFLTKSHGLTHAAAILEVLLLILRHPPSHENLSYTHMI